MLLSLPRISPRVPQTIVQGSAGNRHLRLALAMSQSRLIRQQDLIELAPDQPIPLSVFQKLLENGWQRATHQLREYRALAAHAYLVIQPDSGMLSPYECIPDDTEGMIVVAFGEHRTVVVGPTLMELEALHPGLGGAAMRILTNALAWDSPPYTPMGAYELACYLYWEGMDDESHLVNDDYDIDEVITKQELFGGMPEWAYEPCVKNIVPSDEFLTLAERYKHSAYAPLMTQLHELSAANRTFVRHAQRWNKKGGMISSLVDDPVAGPQLAALYWTTPSEDPIYRVFDDDYQQNMQGGMTEELGAIRFDLTKQGLTGGLKRLYLLDQFFSVLDRTITMLEDYDEKHQSSLLINVFAK